MIHFFQNNFKWTFTGAEKAITALQMTSRSSFGLAQKLLQSNAGAEKMPENLKQEYENVQGNIT